MTLARIVSEQGLDRPGQAAHLSLTHELLADRCGLSRSRVSKELKRLEDEGLIRLSRNRVDLLDLARLSASSP
jgi:DNA-binding MarR family transcriptional regulator